MTSESSGALRQAGGLEIHEVEDGLVVYDSRSDRVHYLNHTAGLVLQLCDGHTATDRIAELIGKAFELPETPTGEVDDCVAQLLQEGLLERS